MTTHIGAVLSRLGRSSLLIAVLVFGAANPAAGQASGPESGERGGPGDVSTAGTGCPKLTGVVGTDSEIKYTFIWVNDGCPTPIRKGFYSASGFGWDHITYRRVVDGLANHETTAYARDLWGAALARIGSLQSNGLMCHQVRYTTPGGTNRTMRVLHSAVNYAGQYGRKGIITAYWLSGHVDAC
jgi:hypothetical protein